mmetsp:Transcript_41140/g.124316  ORF Transcript_41140/g.124316 Transcript_41140/m.124316 type:complete len:102 (+) Transcript_41140:271-576(+)
MVLNLVLFLTLFSMPNGTFPCLRQSLVEGQMRLGKNCNLHYNPLFEETSRWPSKLEYSVSEHLSQPDQGRQGYLHESLSHLSLLYHSKEHRDSSEAFHPST